MRTPTEVYPLVLTWLQALGLPGDANALRALARLVDAVLAGQSLRPSALMRALLSPTVVPARQAYKRVARAWARPWLTSALLTPLLVRAALVLVPPEREGPHRGLTYLALDSVRCGPWEVFVLGVVWHGRVLPLAWRVLAYPWPKGQVGPAVSALLEQVAACWPGERPVHLVADRGFPGQRLFRTLIRLRWGWTVRLRANTGVQVGEEQLLVRTLLGRARWAGWTCWQGSYGRGKHAIPARLVVGRGLVVLPQHRRTVASQHRQAQRQAVRRRIRRYRYASVDQTDPWVVLCTSHPTWRTAVAGYRRRWAIEGSFRDAQSGWDGRHGWDLEPVLTQRRRPDQVERIVGLWALGSLLQTYVGSQVLHGPAWVRALAAGWTTTGRLSIWAHGRFALADRSGRLHDWLLAVLQEGAVHLATGTPPATAHPPPPVLRPAA
jgi:hypothetical protein